MTTSTALPIPAALEKDPYTQFHCMVTDHLKEGKTVFLMLQDKETGEAARWISPGDSLDEILSTELSQENCDKYIVTFVLREDKEERVEVITNIQRWLSIVLQIGFNCSIQVDNNNKNKNNPFAICNKIVSLMPQHKVTPDQQEVGVIQTPESIAERVLELSTFTADEHGNPPTMDYVRSNASKLALVVNNYKKPIKISDNFYLTGYINQVMIGGAPFFMPKLEAALLDKNIGVHYSFTERVVQEVTQPDGTVQKVSKFSYLGDIVENPSQFF